MTIQRITNADERKCITRTILEGLLDWFGIPEAREEYIEASQGKPFFCAYEAGKPVGFLYLKETGKDTMELAVMGVQEKYHRQGIGRSLFEQAKKEAIRLGYSFLQVKTVQIPGLSGTGSLPHIMGRMEPLPDLYYGFGKTGFFLRKSFPRQRAK